MLCFMSCYFTERASLITSSLLHVLTNLILKCFNHISKVNDPNALDPRNFKTRASFRSGHWEVRTAVPPNPTCGQRPRAAGQLRPSLVALPAQAPP